jgi:hypothetical protein
MELPKGKAILMCDQVIEDVSTHKKTLVGIFSVIFSEVFPCMHPHLSLFVALHNGRGKMTISLKMRRIGDVEPIFFIDGKVPFNNPTEVVELVYNLNRIPFQEPGTHAFEIYAEEQMIFESRFELTQLQPPPQP